MNKVRSLCIALVCSALLSGCYQSATPLIAANTGDFPFGADTRYTAFEWNADMRQWDASEPGSVKRDGNHYVQAADGGAPSDATPFVLKSIGGGFYIGQEEADSRFVYDLLKIEGATVYEYALSCSDSDQPLAAQGLIDQITTEGVVGKICTVSSFAKLTQVFRTMQDRQPKAKFVMQRQ
ncbi:MAG TPA: hypothetical protein VHT51_18845 [Micropepsaceae bacterium]|jgi:hypothetical protein|nr:hypothetical protein [Micropepsaceae bacterium]